MTSKGIAICWLVRRSDGLLLLLPVAQYEQLSTREADKHYASLTYEGAVRVSDQIKARLRQRRETCN